METDYSRSGRCPVCSAALWSEAVLEPERCPRCGAELWAVGFSEGPAFFARRPGESVSEFLAGVAGDRLALCPTDVDAVLETADSFDILEFLLEIEEVLKSQNPQGETGNGEIRP